MDVYQSAQTACMSSVWLVRLLFVLFLLLLFLFLILVLLVLLLALLFFLPKEPQENSQVPPCVPSGAVAFLNSLFCLSAAATAYLSSWLFLSSRMGSSYRRFRFVMRKLALRPFSSPWLTHQARRDLLSPEVATQTSPASSPWYGPGLHGRPRFRL